MRAVLPFLVLAVFWLPASAVAATTPAQAIAALNAQRAANGIPAGITENAGWSAGCKNHDVYEQNNGGVLTHTEDTNNAWYTASGKSAAENSVLSKGTSWTAGNPWETAPIHLMQLLAPRLFVTGSDDNAAGYACFQTLAGLSRPAPAAPVIYTYPGDGATGWRASEVAAEGPFTPGDKLGLPQPTRTGPYIYALVDGPGGSMFSVRNGTKLTSASLTAPQGPVDIRTADDTNADLSLYMTPGAFIIPVNPLLTGSVYTATAAFTVNGTPVSKTWSFTTGGPAQPAQPAPPATPDPGTTPGTQTPTPIPTPTPTPTPTTPSGPTAPSLSVKSSWGSKVKGRTVSGSVTCTQRCRVTASVTLKGKKKAAVSKTFTLGANKRTTLKVAIPSKAGSLSKATLLIVAKNLVGGASPKSRTYALTFKR